MNIYRWRIKNKKIKINIHTKPYTQYSAHMHSFQNLKLPKYIYTNKVKAALPIYPLQSLVVVFCLVFFVQYLWSCSSLHTHTHQCERTWYTIAPTILPIGNDVSLQRSSQRLNGVLKLSSMHSGTIFQREGATYLKARWPLRFCPRIPGPGNIEEKSTQLTTDYNGQPSGDWPAPCIHHCSPGNGCKRQ